MSRLALALPLLLLAPTPIRAQGGPPPARVQLDAVRSEEVGQWREVTGSLRARTRSTLASEVEGRVVEVLVREGDRVKAGDTLARLDDTQLGFAVSLARAELASSEAGLLDAKAWLEKAGRDLPRAQRLFETDQVVSEQALDDARTELARAKAAVARARAERQGAQVALARAKDRLADTVVTAPFAGAVVVRHAEAGAWLSVGAAVVEVVSINSLEAWLDIPERYYGQLQSRGGAVQLRVPALGQVLEATFSAVVPQANVLARTLTVRVSLPDSAGLVPGMSVVGLVPTGTIGPSLTVSRDAVLRDDAGEFVYFDGGGRAVVARVETLFTVGERVAVRAPTLQPGMNIVTEGHQRLFPGQALSSLDEGGS